MPKDPQLPEIRLEIVEDVTPAQPPGFLRLVRRRIRAQYPDGTQSAPFVYDEVDREALDAVVIAAHYRTKMDRWIYLRSAIRPSVMLRDPRGAPDRAKTQVGLWELPAGLIEVDEQKSEAGAHASAVRELEEELGFRVTQAELRPLGPSLFPAAGITAERHFFFEVEVDPASRGEPELDGSPFEHGGVVAELRLEEALAWCRDGRIVDGKTEIGLRRLQERFR